MLMGNAPLTEVVQDRLDGEGEQDASCSRHGRLSRWQPV